MTEKKEQSSKFLAFIKRLRLLRTLAAAAISGSAAYAAEAGIGLALWMTLAGWCTAAAGFSLNAVIHRDSGGTNREDINKPIITAFALVFSAAAFIIILLKAPWAFIPWGIMLGLGLAMALPFLAKPLIYTASIGVLHALHLILGGVAGKLNLGLILLAVVLFFAIIGARGIIDIRNFPQDLMTRKQTLPKRFGITKTVKLAIVCFALAYVLAVGTYFTRHSHLLYFAPVAILIIVGLLCIILFVKRAGPGTARKFTPFFTLGTVLLICLAMILGSL